MSPEDLQSYLESLPDKLQEEISDVLQEQGQRLSDAQRAALQELEAAPGETGHLEESCRVEVRENPVDVHVVAGGDLTTSDVRAGTGVPYDHALAFEFGNSRQPARPFFWNTYRAMKAGIDEAISEAIEKVIDERDS